MGLPTEFGVPPAQRTPAYPLAMGFAAVLILMLFLTAMGLHQLTASQRRLDRIVDNHLAKITLVSRMYAAARERTVSLQRLILVEDPFERDEQWVHFQGYAGEFTRARQALMAMELTAKETALLQRQGYFTGIALPLQDKVLALVATGERAQAQRLLVDQAIPAQDNVLKQMQALSDMQEREAAEGTTQARREYQAARLWLVLLAAATLALAVMVAITVVRRTRRADRALRCEKERAQVTLHTLNEAVIRADEHGAIEYLNPVAVHLTGWDNEDAAGLPLEAVFQLVSEDQCDAQQELVMQLLRCEVHTSLPIDVVIYAKGGKQYCIELTASPISDEAGGVAGTVVVFRDVTEIRALARELTYHASHDTLTGLYNRREFERSLQEALHETRTASANHALCYLDLDMFKVVNDTCGHLAGDELLKQIAQLLKQRLRTNDTLARLGGDEFAILLRDCSLEQASAVGEQIRAGMKDFRFVWEDKTMAVGMSMGLMQLSADSGDIKDVFRTVDVACRVAKDEGRNRVHVFRPNDLTVTRREREIDWVARIGRAIHENLFQLHAQWIRPLAPGRTQAAHCEILLRMLDENGQLVLPAAFLPAAERYHIMPAVDRWVVRATLDMLRELPRNVLEAFGCCNINISGQSLADAEFLPFLRQELAQDPVIARRVCFEITETEAITNLSSAVQLIARVREIGCRFALDDFGSGMSSFSYLKNLPVDYLKIDGAFVSNVVTDPTDHAMVSSINQVAHIMGIATIAEYVETEAVYAELANIGVDYVQGFVVSQPQPFRELLRELPVPAADGQGPIAALLRR